jgi:transposase, IS30 family
MVPEVVQPFWAALQRGEFITDAAEGVGTYRKKGARWMVAEGGVRPRRGRDLQGRYLSFAEREEIALARAAGEGVRSIARRLSRSPSTISRELARNADRDRCYRASTAHARAWERASRPKPAKLWVNQRLRELVQSDLERRYSPEQIAGRLRMQFPDQPEMWVSTETIYQSLYVRSRGALRRELTKCLRTGRALRKPGRRAAAHNRPPDMINIAQRPAEAEDRAVPGHWEGDLLIGKNNKTAIGTLVERSTGYALLVALPDGYKPDQVAPALAQKIKTLPDSLRRTLTWDQGPEMRDWKQVRIDAASRSTSATHTRPGSAARTRTPTVSCASTSPRAPTSASTPSRSWTGSLTSSTTDHANGSGSTSPQRGSRSCSSCTAPGRSDTTSDTRPCHCGHSE